MSVISESLEHLMTAEAYAEVDHDTPYIFSFHTHTAALHYVGAHHTVQFDDPQFELIHQQFDTFKPSVVLAEGFDMNRHAVISQVAKDSTFTDAIKRGGEAFYTVKLALEHGVRWECPEPDDVDLYAHFLEKGFTKDEIAAWQTMYLLPQFLRRDELVNFKDYTEPFREKFAAKTKWEGFDYSFEHAVRATELILGRKVKLHNQDEAEQLSDPIRWQHKKDDWNVINEIARTSSKFRDETILRHINTLLLANERVFVVYGASHAVMQEPALRYLCSRLS